MTKAHCRSRSIIVAALIAVISVVGGCASLGERHTLGLFTSVRPVLESNCVHCHGPSRLAHMPAFADTRELANLIGSANWIVPGHPERSRFLAVVRFADNQPGAMPPTGHAISRSEVEALRAWIAAGALLPAGAPVVFTPRGEGPRGR